MESLRNEINFRSRRGLQELDILLKRFLEKHLSNLEESSLKALIEILDMEDNDLADLLIYKTKLFDFIRNNAPKPMIKLI